MVHFHTGILDAFYHRHRQVQAKVKEDHHSIVQTMQDIACCKEKYPSLVCRSVSAQFIEASSTIVMFELVEQDNTVKVKNERHYQLVPYSDISPEELIGYRH